MYHLSTTGGKDNGDMQVALIWSPMVYLLDTPNILGPDFGRSGIITFIKRVVCLFTILLM